MIAGESVFPFIDVYEPPMLAVAVQPPKEYLWDFDRNDFILENGKFTIAEGDEAIKLWICKMLRTKRYQYLIYSWNYGQELDSLIGSKFSKDAAASEIKRHLEEALLVNPHIKGITQVIVDFTGDNLQIEFTVLTDYGEVNISV